MMSTAELLASKGIVLPKYEGICPSCQWTTTVTTVGKPDSFKINCPECGKSMTLVKQ